MTSLPVHTPKGDEARRVLARLVLGVPVVLRALHLRAVGGVLEGALPHASEGDGAGRRGDELWGARGEGEEQENSEHGETVTRSGPARSVSVHALQKRSETQQHERAFQW